jgi:hypothetical protein
MWAPSSTLGVLLNPLSPCLFQKQDYTLLVQRPIYDVNLGPLVVSNSFPPLLVCFANAFPLESSSEMMVQIDTLFFSGALCSIVTRASASIAFDVPL